MNSQKNKEQIEKINLPFNTKEEYLVWRSEWRANYNELSDLIRRLKHDRKTEYYEKEKGTTEKQREKISRITRDFPDYKGWIYQTTLDKIKSAAFNALLERAASKVLAEKLYQESKVAVA